MKKILHSILFIITAVTLVLSLALSSSAYCIINVQDKKTEDWEEISGIVPFMPLTIYAEKSTSQMYIDALKYGINVWNNAGFGTLFVYGGEKENLGIQAQKDHISTFMVTYGSTYSYESKHSLGRTTNAYIRKSGRLYIKDVDIRINGNKALNLNPSGPQAEYDVIYVVLHELGHAAGLADTEAGFFNPISVMNGTAYACTTSFRTLREDDIEGLRYLYENYEKPPSVNPDDSNFDPDTNINPDDLIYPGQNRPDTTPDTNPPTETPNRDPIPDGECLDEDFVNTNPNAANPE